MLTALLETALASSIRGAGSGTALRWGRDWRRLWPQLSGVRRRGRGVLTGAARRSAGAQGVGRARSHLPSLKRCRPTVHGWRLTSAGHTAPDMLRWAARRGRDRGPAWPSGPGPGRQAGSAGRPGCVLRACCVRVI